MLIDIPAEEIHNFIQVLKTELPKSLFIINFIETSSEWKSKNEELEISLLYTARSMETGVFIGICKSGCVSPIIYVYALDHHEKDLEEALQQIQLNWKTIKRFEGIISKHEAIIEKLIFDNCSKILDKNNYIVWYMSNDNASKLEIECPEEVDLAPLTEQHAYEIYEIWLMKDIYTIDNLKYSIRYNDDAAYGVFCKSTGELLARCVRSHTGILAALQTIEKARKKGYAKLLLKYIAKKMAEKGLSPCSYSADYNQGVRKTFLSCGYDDVYRMKNYNLE